MYSPGTALRPNEFTPVQADSVRTFYKYTFALFGLLLVVHMGFIGSALPYVYSDQEASVCGARKLITFLTHRVTTIGLIFVVSSATLLPLALWQSFGLETRVRAIASVLVASMLAMLVVTYAEVSWAARLPTLPADVHGCAFPANAAVW